MAVAATRRIAAAIVSVLDRPCPASTLAEMGRAAGAAPSTLRMWCRAVEIHPRDVLAFARALWVVYWAVKLKALPNDLLEFAEKRTLDRFLLKSGPLGDRSVVVSVAAFCARQTILGHEQIVAEVVRLVAVRQRKESANGGGS